MLQVLPFLALALPAVDAARSSGHKHAAGHARAAGKQRLQEKEVQNVKRADGGSSVRLTYYDTSVGLGACGIFHPNSEYTVALNSAQFQAYGSSYPSPVCGSQITISVNGKTAQATIQDECPTCPYGALDLSEDLFSFFADHSVGVLTADWWYGGGGGGSVATTTSEAYVAPTTSAAPAYVAPTTSAEPAYVAPTTTAEPAYVAPTTTAEPAYVAPSSAAPEYVAPTTTAQPAAVPTAVAEEPAPVEEPAPTTTFEAAPTTTEAPEPEPTFPAEEETPAPVSTGLPIIPAALNGSQICSGPTSFVLLNTSSIIYNGTLAGFVNTTFAAFGALSKNATAGRLPAFNATSAFHNASAPFFHGWNVTYFANSTLVSIKNETAALLKASTAYCYNGTLVPTGNSSLFNGSFAGLNATAFFNSSSLFNFTSSPLAFNASTPFNASSFLSLFGGRK